MHSLRQFAVLCCCCDVGVVLTEIAVLQFEASDKLMHAYSQFPKGSLRLVQHAFNY